MSLQGILNSGRRPSTPDDDNQDGEEFKNAILADWQATRQVSLDTDMQRKLNARLEHADRITRDMSRQEYMDMDRV